MTSFINESVTEMSKAFTMTDSGNMTAASIDGDNITDSTLFDENVTSHHDDNIRTTPNELMFHFAYTVLVYGLRSLFASLTTFGNLLIIIAVARFEDLQNNTSYFMCSLAVADLLQGAMTPIAITLQVIGRYHPQYLSICLFHIVSTLLAISGNIFSIFMIAVDRYMFIAYPLHYPIHVTSKKTFLAIGFTWLFATVQLAVMIAVGKRPVIGMTCTYSIFLTRTMWNYITVPEYLVASVMTTVLYIVISYIAYKHGQRIAALRQPYNSSEATSNRQQKRTAKMMIMVVGTFFLCYIPILIVTILEWFFPESILLYVLEKIAVVIAWTNTWINPFIYAWKSKQFELAFRKLLGLKINNPRLVHIQSPRPVVNN